MRLLELDRFCTAESSRAERPALAAGYHSMDSPGLSDIGVWCQEQHLWDNIWVSFPNSRAEGAAVICLLETQQGGAQHLF